MIQGGRRLLLDANTLLLLFVGLFDRTLIPQFKRTTIFAVEDYDLLAEIVTQFTMLVTTPHILCEVSNLSGQLVDERRLSYFTVFARSLAGFDERYTAATALRTQPIFNRLGLTDAGIAHIAQEESLTVLTTDLDLWAYLTGAGVDAYNFNHVRRFGWEN